ncbi:MAG: type VI secretion protein IcmF/TssM N-terminal domain-containing protein [Thermodesulfobacteriota bacterium]
MVKFLLKSLLFLFLLALLAGGCYLLTLWQDWPLWLGGSIFAGILALVFLIFFLRKLYFRRREKRFVSRVIDQDEAKIQAEPSSDQASLREMQKRWARSVQILKDSKLRMQGNPLYVLPWYMVLGESGSGKTTAIKRSGLNSIITDLSPEAGTSSSLSETLHSTRNVDWCFFKEAIILDTAGRYAIPVDEGQDKKEWESFLALLTRYRRKEPLNGLVVTISTERLLKGDQEQLKEYGLSLRRRINDMMSSMGARFPVYVLVTKLDLLFGLDSLLETLSQQEARQSMGYSVNQGSPDPEEISRNALEHVAQRLRELRLSLLSRSRNPRTAAIAFPAELRALAPALSAFMQGCFAENPYSETPFLRGIYFSSGRQEGQVQTSLMHKSELFQKKPLISVAKSEKGLFLTDLFADILPGDRGIFTPLREFLKWRTVTRNLVLISWLLFTFFLAGLFTYSFVNTREALEVAAEPFPEPPELTGHIGHDLYMMSLYGNAIELMQDEAAKSWIGHMGLNHSQQAAKELKRSYVKMHRNRILHPLDKQINSLFSQMDAKELSSNISEYISYVSWRVNMIESRLSGGDAQSVSGPPQQALALVMGGRMPEISPLFKQVYEDYLQWSRVDDVLRAEAQELRMWLDKIITQEGVELHWLVDWADTRPGVKPVTLGEFWRGPSVDNSSEVKVKGAFTPDGYQEIDNFLSQVGTAVEDQQQFARRAKQFRKWYTAQYYQAWEKFARQFSQGTRRLFTPGDWQSQASEMATLDNPYFQLLERIDRAFEPVSGILQQPRWGSLATNFTQLRSAITREKKTATLEERLQEKLQEELKKTAGEFSPQAMQELQAKVKAGKALHNYLQSLHKFLPPTASRESGFKFAGKLYGAEGGKGGQDGSASNPLQAAEGELHTLKGNLKGADEDSSEKASPFWDAARGPLVYMVDYVSNEASCQLQMLWEGRVLSRTEQIPELELRRKLFAQDGLVQKFSNGPASPFIKRDKDGWTAKRLLGVSFPLKPSFLKFLDQASQNRDTAQDKYTIHISGSPTDVNQKAKADPVSTKLSLDCEDGVQTITNFNYPSSEDFVWKPGKCGDVTLSINFPSLTLKQTWKGREGMQEFLSDFSDNSKKYEPEDFDKHEDELESLDVDYITVGYQMKGAESVRKLLEQKPPDPPQEISWCWHRED